MRILCATCAELSSVCRVGSKRSQISPRPQKYGITVIPVDAIPFRSAEEQGASGEPEAGHWFRGSTGDFFASPLRGPAHGCPGTISRDRLGRNAALFGDFRDSRRCQGLIFSSGDGVESNARGERTLGRALV